MVVQKRLLLVLFFTLLPAFILSLTFPDEIDEPYKKSDNLDGRRNGKNHRYRVGLSQPSMTPLPPSSFVTPVKKSNLFNSNSTVKPLIGSTRKFADQQTTLPPIKPKDNSIVSDKDESFETEKDKIPMKSSADFGNREDCVCVPYYQCDNGKVIEDGSGLIDPRINTKQPSTKSASVSNLLTLSADSVKV